MVGDEIIELDALLAGRLLGEGSEVRRLHRRIELDRWAELFKSHYCDFTPKLKWLAGEQQSDKLRTVDLRCLRALRHDNHARAMHPEACFHESPEAVK